MSDRQERCETCRFWEEGIADAVAWGTCKRFPPQKIEFTVFDEGGCVHEGRWPDTEKDSWCGEWKGKG